MNLLNVNVTYDPFSDFFKIGHLQYFYFYYKAFVSIPLLSNFTVLEMYETVYNAKDVLLINPNHH